MNTRVMRKLTLTALFAALICVMTFVIHVPLGAGGYVHLGDGFIYLAAAFLPTPYAMAAAGVGAALADLFAGFPIYLPFTMVIKALMVLPFTAKKETVLCVRNVIATVTAGVICTVGYYLTDVLLYGSWVAPLASLFMGSLAQSGAAVVLFLACGALLDRVHMKRLWRRFE